MAATTGAELPEVALEAWAGEPFRVTVPVLDAAGQLVPAAQLLSARAQVRPETRAATELAEFSTEGDAEAEPSAEITDAGVVLTAPAGQAWSMGAIELLPAAA